MVPSIKELWHVPLPSDIKGLDLFKIFERENGNEREMTDMCNLRLYETIYPRGQLESDTESEMS